MDRRIYLGFMDIHLSNLVVSHDDSDDIDTGDGDGDGDGDDSDGGDRGRNFQDMVSVLRQNSLR